MTTQTKENILTGVGIFLVIAMLAVFTLGTSYFIQTLARTKFQDEAADKGHAEYYLDKDHKKQWRWKELSPPRSRGR